MKCWDEEGEEEKPIHKKCSRLTTIGSRASGVTVQHHILQCVFFFLLRQFCCGKRWWYGVVSLWVSTSNFRGHIMRLCYGVHNCLLPITIKACTHFFVHLYFSFIWSSSLVQFTHSSCVFSRFLCNYSCPTISSRWRPRRHRLISVQRSEMRRLSADDLLNRLPVSTSGWTRFSSCRPLQSDKNGHSNHVCVIATPQNGR